MTKIMTFWRAHPTLAFAALALALTGVKLVALYFSDAELGPDEAQYWAWSRNPDFGYFSKPPLIAWTIAATTAVFGNAEWAVRLAAPFFHLGTALFLFALGRRLYGPAVGFWAGLGWLTLPGAMLSSMLITTDAPLLFFWSAALYFFFRMIEARETNTQAALLGALLGASIGLGLLSKYAMIYFPLGAALAFAAAPDFRRNFHLRDALVALGVALFVIAPNVLWNASHDFQTLSHTAANADWRNSQFQIAKLFEFLFSQFGVFGPILFLIFLWGLITLSRRLFSAGAARSHDLALLAFALPPIVIVSVQAFISRAHANWAAAAYPAAIVLATAWAFRARIAVAVKASFALHLTAGLAFLFAMTDFSVADDAGFSGSLKSVRGWEEQARAIGDAAAGYDALLVDDRETMGALLYYGRGGLPVYAWNSNGRIDDHYEAFMAYDSGRARRLVYVSTIPRAVAVNRDFAKVAPLGEVAADLKGGRTRTLYLFGVSGYGKKKR